MNSKYIECLRNLGRSEKKIEIYESFQKSFTDFETKIQQNQKIEKNTTNPAKSRTDI